MGRRGNAELSPFFPFPSLPTFASVTRSQLALAPFCSLPASQSLFTRKYEKPVEEAQVTQAPLLHGGHIVPGDQKSSVLPRQASPPRF